MGMQLDPNRQDKPIINTIALLDNLDKNINTFAMRVREWYAWHFPELTKIVTDNVTYAKVARVVRVRDSYNADANPEELNEACGSEDVSKEIVKAMKISMGQDIIEMDMSNIDHFADEVIKLSAMRLSLHTYLKAKMNLVAEKALFRALKTKGNTPKYGLIFHSTFIGRAQLKNKGRISRYLANKCSIASRIDCFSEEATTVFGEKLRDQVEERLTFLSEGTKPRKNLDVMQEVKKQIRKKKKKGDKKKAQTEANEGEEVVEEAPKKRKKTVEVETPEDAVVEKASKKKRRKDV